MACIPPFAFTIERLMYKTGIWDCSPTGDEWELFRPGWDLLACACAQFSPWIPSCAKFRDEESLGI